MHPLVSAWHIAKMYNENMIIMFNDWSTRVESVKKDTWNIIRVKVAQEMAEDYAIEDYKILEQLYLDIFYAAEDYVIEYYNILEQLDLDIFYAAGVVRQKIHISREVAMQNLLLCLISYRNTNFYIEIIRILNKDLLMC